MMIAEPKWGARLENMRIYSLSEGPIMVAPGHSELAADKEDTPKWISKNY